MLIAVNGFHLFQQVKLISNCITKEDALLFH